MTVTYDNWRLAGSCSFRKCIFSADLGLNRITRFRWISGIIMAKLLYCVLLQEMHHLLCNMLKMSPGNKCTANKDFRWTWDSVFFALKDVVSESNDAYDHNWCASVIGVFFGHLQTVVVHHQSTTQVTSDSCFVHFYKYFLQILIHVFAPFWGQMIDNH